MFSFIKDKLKTLFLIKRMFDDSDWRLQITSTLPGHFYSPYPSLKEIRAREKIIWGELPRSLPSLDINENGQVALLNDLKSYYKEFPFRDKATTGLRYYLSNGMFSYMDAVVFYSILRHLKPKRIIEVGSGFSSALMLDTSQLFLAGNINCTFIEPYPDRLFRLITDTDKQRHNVIEAPLQQVDLALFKHLSENDILFIDSSHVSKVDSDVNRIVFDVLPILNKDVWIHFHDIHYPFQYFKEWIYRGIAWNEVYLLRAFLQYNQAFQIQCFNSFMAHFYREWLEKEMPLCLVQPPGSLWLKKI
jgi:hypothetical protein